MEKQKLWLRNMDYDAQVERMAYVHMGFAGYWVLLWAAAFIGVWIPASPFISVPLVFGLFAVAEGLGLSYFKEATPTLSRMIWKSTNYGKLPNRYWWGLGLVWFSLCSLGWFFTAAFFPGVEAKPYWGIVAYMGTAACFGTWLVKHFLRKGSSDAAFKG